MQRMEVMDALCQYYGIYLCEHWIRDNLKDTFISLRLSQVLISLF